MRDNTTQHESLRFVLPTRAHRAAADAFRGARLRRRARARVGAAESATHSSAHTCALIARWKQVMTWEKKRSRSSSRTVSRDSPSRCSTSCRYKSSRSASWSTTLLSLPKPTRRPMRQEVAPADGWASGGLEPLATTLSLAPGRTQRRPHAPNRTGCRALEGYLLLEQLGARAEPRPRVASRTLRHLALALAECVNHTGPHATDVPR